ncbi:MAG: DNA methyltransferase, partial [Anaerolineales bacterium]
KAKILFDPFCGSGTALVEATLRGINAFGTDLNPLARLITKAKTALPDPFQLEEQIISFDRQVLQDQLHHFGEPHVIYGIPNLEFWFKPQVIEKLWRVREFVKALPDEAIRLFFQVAFSETVRESSNTRKDEFKLYRYSLERLESYDPDVYGIMSGKLHRNLQGYKKYRTALARLKSTAKVIICDFNTVEGIPSEIIPEDSIDLVITSPPYGDSNTTVAYGQFSRLSAAWLELEEPHKIDRKLMGSTPSQNKIEFTSNLLNRAIDEIYQKDQKRALQVVSFYHDLRASTHNVAKVICQGGVACYVVGNRKVRGVVLPTDQAIQTFFEECGFGHVATYRRNIPNKRMPLKNSPTNVAGVLDHTMTGEYIVVMRRV